MRPNNGTLPPNVKPSTTNIGTGNNKVKPNSGNAPPPKKSGKSFFNYFRGGKKKNVTATAPAKKGKSFFNYFKGGKKKNVTATAPAKKGKSFFNYFKGGKKKNVNVKPNNGIGKNTLPPTMKPNKIENNKINNMTEELINNAVNNEISNSARKKQLNNEAKRQNRAKPKNNNNNFNATKELNKQLNNEAKRQNRAKPKNNNNFNATKEFNKQMAIRNMTDELITNAVNEELNNEISNSNLTIISPTNERNNQMVVRNMTDELITNAVNKELNKELSNSRLNNVNLNNATKNMILSINKATTLKELRKIYLKGTLKLHPNKKGGNVKSFRAFMKAHNKKKKLLNSGNTKSNAANGNGNGTKNNKVLAIANKPVNNRNADVKYVTNQILKQLQNDVATEIKLGGRAAEPIYNNSSNSNNNNNNKKPIYNNSSNNNKKTAQNNPLFEPNVKNNPIFNNKKSESNELSKHINNLGLPNANKKKLMNLFNTTNQTLEAAKRNANTLSNTRKLQNKNSFNGGLRLGANNNNVSLPPSNNAVNVNNVKVNVKNFNSERNKLKNKITKELNMIPNNDGKFQERKGFTKGRIGLWARELRAAKSIGDLDAIENALNKKVELRRNIENKYTKAGLTKVEKMNHRRRVVKFVNNVDERRKLIETQVKNKNNNNNTNSVISNYNSNDNSNRAKKMKYKSRENFMEAKKVELRNLAKKTDTNFDRNINRMETRKNVFKLRGRIKGAIRRNEALSRL